ncbi:MAG: hypothetical protein E6K53_03220 [Gammaproteobacteria bacterium]|nr:MAG: hypothetical protein E6K53_03220 [Gammaproteobacteria bacterium]
MHSSFRLLRLLAAAVVLSFAAACSSNAVKDNATTAPVKSPQQYDLVVLADKDGQFDYDGATLNAEDLRSHIRFRNETNQPVHTILLRRGEKQKITNDHVAGMAGVARDLKAEAYVEDNDGKLKVIAIRDDK